MNRFISLPVRVFKKLGNKVLNKIDAYTNQKTEANSNKVYEELMNELESLAKDFTKEIENLTLADEDKAELDAATNDQGELKAEALAAFAKRYGKNAFTYLMETIYLQHEKAGLLTIENHSLWIEKSALLFRNASRAYSIALSNLVMEYHNSKTAKTSVEPQTEDDSFFFAGFGSPAEG